MDVGTGFYVEKTTEQAKKFYETKAEELGKNVKDLETIVQGKNQNLRLIEEGMERSGLSVAKVLLTQGYSHASKGSRKQPGPWKRLRLVVIYLLRHRQKSSSIHILNTEPNAFRVLEPQPTLRTSI